MVLSRNLTMHPNQRFTTTLTPTTTVAAATAATVYISFITNYGSMNNQVN